MTDFGIATNQYRCFDVFLPSQMTDSIAPGRCGRPKSVVLFLIQFLLNSGIMDEKRLTIWIVRCDCECGINVTNMCNGYSVSDY
jgi:hypothetical protein